MQDSRLIFSSPLSGMQLCSPIQIFKPRRENREVVVRTATVTALWDTGAVTSSISRRLAKRLHLKVHERAVLDTAAGVLPTFKDIVLVDLLLDGSVIPVKAAIVDAIPGNNNDFLIGMDVIQCGELNISTDHDHHKFNVRFTPYPGLFQPIGDLLPNTQYVKYIDESDNS